MRGSGRAANPDRMGPIGAGTPDFDRPLLRRRPRPGLGEIDLDGAGEPGPPSRRSVQGNLPAVGRPRDAERTGEGG
jgi:hypothetical protein